MEGSLVALCYPWLIIVSLFGYFLLLVVVTLRDFSFSGGVPPFSLYF
jgi:hypothetical protein